MSSIGRLKGKRGTNRIRGFGKLRDKRVPSNLMRGSPMTDDGLRETSEGVLNALVSNGFVRLDECRRAHHVGVQ